MKFMKWEQFLKMAYPKELAAEDKIKRTKIFRCHRWIGVRLAFLFYHLKISANAVSISRIIFSFIPLYCLSFAPRGDIILPLIGAFLLYLQHFFDSVDGAIARASGKVNKLGADLDNIANDVSRFSILVLLASFTGNMIFLIFTLYLSYFVVSVRNNLIKSKIAYDTEYKRGFVAISRIFFSIQTMLFILPMLIALNNIFNWDLATLSYSVISIYTIITLIWFLLSFFKSPEKNNQ
jgi:phosphatidylglycerophosphate synthase